MKMTGDQQANRGAIITGIVVLLLGVVCAGGGVALLAWRILEPDDAAILPLGAISLSVDTPTPGILSVPVAPPPLSVNAAEVVILPVSELPLPTPSEVAPSPTVTRSVTPTETSTPTPSRTFTPTITRTATITHTATNTATHTHTATATQTPSLTQPSTPTATYTITLTITQSPTATTTNTAVPSVTSTITPSATRTPTPTSSPTATKTPTATVAPSNTTTYTPTATPSQTPTLIPTRTPTVTPTAPPVVSQNQSVPDRIVIEKIGLNAPVMPVGQHPIQIGERVYSQWDVLDAQVAGWHQNSAPLGKAGNTVLNGHHNGNGEVFRYLIALEPGDMIALESGEKRYLYIVAQTMVLEEEGQTLATRQTNARWILPTSDERVTLITCWPPDASTHRLVIVAFSAKALDQLTGIP